MAFCAARVVGTMRHKTRLIVALDVTI